MVAKVVFLIVKLLGNYRKKLFFFQFECCCFSRDAGARIACGTISPTMIDLSATSNPQNISPTVADLFRQLFP